MHQCCCRSSHIPTRCSRLPICNHAAGFHDRRLFGPLIKDLCSSWCKFQPIRKQSMASTDWSHQDHWTPSMWRRFFSQDGWSMLWNRSSWTGVRTSRNQDSLLLWSQCQVLWLVISKTPWNPYHQRGYLQRWHHSFDFETSRTASDCFWGLRMPAIQ